MSHSWGLVEMQFDPESTPGSHVPGVGFSLRVQIPESEALLDFCLRALGNHGRTLQRPKMKARVLFTECRAPHPTPENRVEGTRGGRRLARPRGSTLQQDPSSAGLHHVGGCHHHRCLQGSWSPRD